MCVSRWCAGLLAAVVAAPAWAGELYPAMQAPFAAWVEAGKARAVIVADTKAQRESGAAELNAWLERITGAALPVVDKADNKRPRVILGGPTAWRRLGVKSEQMKLGPDGYVIRTVGRDTVIAGHSDLGTLFGVGAFLEHYLDCRWFWPGDGGVFYPKRTTLRIGRVDELSRPDFRVRWVIKTRDCARFNRLNVGIRHADEFRIQWFVHTWLRLVPPKTYWKTHPEYFADAGGKRTDPTGKHAQVNLCTSNPEVAQTAARTIDELLTRDPGVDMVSVDPMDTQKFCTCPGCKTLYDAEAPYERRASRLVFDFSNRVAELVAPKHPDLLLKTIAYHTYLAPPADPAFRPHKNLAIQFCRFMCHNHALDDPTCAENRHFHEPLKAWCKLSRHVMLYEYYHKASWCGLPWPIVHTLRRDIPYLRKLGVMGVATQWSHNYAGEGLGFYVASKLLWDADLDVDALLADFYAKAYGAAAEPMRRYHERLEQEVVSLGVHMATQRPYRDMLRVFNAPLIAELDGCLKAAEKQVREARAKARVQLVRRNWRYAQLVHEYLTAVARGVAPLGRQRWSGALGAGKMDQLVKRTQPLADRVKAFLTDKRSHGAMRGFDSYEKLLVNPRNVAGRWFSQGDRPSPAVVLDKVQWLEQSGQAPVARPARFTLWVYGNDLDWNAKDGPEHTIAIVDRNGKRIQVGVVGRRGRQGDRVNMAFVVPGVSADAVPIDQVEVTIANPPGGPYASRIFAVYLMPEDGTPDDQAQRLIERDIDAVRRRAIGFVEYGYNGRYSSEGDPCVTHVKLPKAR